MAWNKLILLVAVGCLPAVLCGVTIGQIDTFQGGTIQGWFAGGGPFGVVPPVPPQVIANGGPAGAGDQFLQITALGGNGPGSRLVAINLAQWAGDYLASGIIGIAMDLKNFGVTDLTIRLLLEDPIPGPPLNLAVTTFGQVLPAGGDWIHGFFPISPAALTVIFGDANTLLGNVTVLRIIDSPTPTEAVPIAGTLGVDNITAVPEPSTFLLLLPALAVGLVTMRRR